MNQKDSNKKVLIAPLDWGLGHTTRCIPIISDLLKNNIEVIFCGEEPSATIIKNEFPTIEILYLKGYKIRYSKNRNLFFIKIMLQIPRIIKAIKHENKWLQQVVKARKVDAVISDNRLGFYNKQIPSVYITHQLSIRTGNSFLDKILQRIHYYYINKFNVCWVPDSFSEYNMAGSLSHPKKYPQSPVQYIGPLSRFNKTVEKKKYSIAIVLSGPEPQRTILENIIFKQIVEIKEPVIIVRGLPITKEKIKTNNSNIIQHNHLAGHELCEVMQQSEVVFARSGYSTIMDLITIQQKAILIPTPGQTEQEYLAEYLFKKNIFFTARQDEFILEKAVIASHEFKYSNIHIQPSYTSVLSAWLKEI